MWLGRWRDRTDQPLPVLLPCEPIYCLGVYFSYDEMLCENNNFWEKLSDLRETLNLWSSRDLTLLGKITIVKAFGLSKLVYNSSLLTVPHGFTKEVNKVISDFVWNNKPPKVKRTTMIGDNMAGPCLTFP
jgi:hypothetical protein